MREGDRKERDDLQTKGGGGAARFDLRDREDEREREKEEHERREKERGKRRGGRRPTGEDHRKECRRLVVFHRRRRPAPARSGGTLLPGRLDHSLE